MISVKQYVFLQVREALGKEPRNLCTTKDACFIGL